MKFYKNYKEWNKLKEILNSVDISIPFKEGEIWWVYFGLNIGIEMDGKGDDYIRPAIVINRFNKYHAWIVPLTSTEKLLSGVHVQLFIDNIQFIKIIESIKNILPKTPKT